MSYFKNISIFSILALTLTIVGQVAPALSEGGQRWVAVNVNQKSDVVVAPGETTKVINFAFFSKSSVTSTLNINLTGPKNAKVSVKSLGVASSSSLESALKKLKSMYTIEIASYGGKMTKAVSIGANSGSSGGNNGGFAMMCNGEASSMFYNYLVSQFIAKYGRAPRSDDDLCDGLFPGWRENGNGNENGNQGSSTLPTLNATSHVIKDACAKAKYVVVLSVDLSKISKESRTAGYTLSLDLIEKVYGGNRTATVKMGDGKFKEWILLAAMPSPANKHAYTTWSSSKSAKRLLSSSTKNMAKFYGLYGISLPREQLRGGGKTTVIVFDTTQSYGLCVKKVRARQCINGYKGGDCR